MVLNHHPAIDYHVGDKVEVQKGMQAPNYNFKCINSKFRPLNPLLSLPNLEVLEPLWHLKSY